MHAFRYVNVRRYGTWFVVTMFAFFSLLPLFSLADESLPSADFRNPMIRVHLTRMNLSDRIDLSLISPYLLTNLDGEQICLKEGTQVAFLLRNNEIYMHYQGLVQRIGEELTLTRTGMNAKGESGFYRTNFEQLYIGDLQLQHHEGLIRPILKIHVEDYLLGVLPYEMSESFPLEALKAQAVTARTYALRKQDDKRPYDVVDTSNDQVFRGYVPGNVRCEQAVEETRGVCGFYKGSLAQCYYSASNGGQMELVESVWQTTEDYGYYTFGADQYDLDNPESVVRIFEIPKEYTADAPYELRQLVAAHAGEYLETNDPECVRIDGVNALSLTDPAHESSKLVKTLVMNLNISVRHKREAINLIDSDTEEVSLFLTEPSPAVRAETTCMPAQMPEAEYTYTAYQALEKPVELHIPIFPDAEYILGLDISGNFENEIWSISEKPDRYFIEARRYGHGVGMSQRGAQQMAGVHGKNFREILAFYYPGLQLKRFEDGELIFADIPFHLREEAGPAASPTPRPTLMPATMLAQDGQWFASVTEIADDSSLNLRSEPNLSSEIRMRLYKNQRLLVVERCPQEGWVRVQTDAVEGYVMEKYLTRIP